ncbi:hypothetical protein GTQ99_13215 [Kineococcus sp. T13]|uniref:hypothetical protein n=1 Tax=Kineococcus vitellinus TaxID=2696565 RepID=UPI0014128A49|nr:hypothetical protein [Kineococcus vitellinus]NAZ76366.1 hypothetical protein [Kineococcus vitellinus]
MTEDFVGPNAALDDLAQARVCARALHAHENRLFEIGYEVRRLQRDQPQAFPDGVWHGVALPDSGSWYWKVRESGHGVSARKLPEGAAVGTFVTVPRNARPVRDRLLTLLQRLEQAAAVGGSVTGDDVAVVRQAVQATEDDEPCLVTERLLAPARRGMQDQLGPPAIQAMLGRALEELALMRRRRGVDLLTTVGVGWSIQLFGTAVQRASSPQHVAWIMRPLLTSSEVDPMALLSATASALLDVGLADVLAGFAERGREASQRLVGQALDSQTLEEHLDGLFGALPHTFSSLVLFRFLAENGPSEDRSRHKKVATMVDERVVRQLNPFQTQVLDLDDQSEWRRHREVVARERTGESDDAARVDRAVKKLIEDELFYPRSMAARLTA